MKLNIKESFKQLITDRYLFVLILVLILSSFIFAIIIGLSIHSSELQLVSHYSAYGITHLYRDQWFYLFVFTAFELIVATLHSIIAIKIAMVRSHSLAIMFAWIGIGLVLLGWATAFSVINVWTPL